MWPSTPSCTDTWPSRSPSCPCPSHDLPLEALERRVLNGYLATNRALQPEMIGSLGLIECQAGPRCRRIVHAMRRLEVPAGAVPFYEEHATADPRHGKDWIDGAVAPLVARHPSWGPRIRARRRAWRAAVNRRFFAAMQRALRRRERGPRRVTIITCDFGPLRVDYDDRVLAPRPWTLLQSRHGAAWLEQSIDGPIIELHCGAGQIGQATAKWSGRALVQVDDDPVACGWAQHNAPTQPRTLRRVVSIGRGSRRGGRTVRAGDG